jgi:hypothetical protein
MAGAALQAGCFGGGDGVRPAGEAEKAVAATVRQLERATARHDYVAICGDLLTASARRRAGGPDCVSLTRSAAAGVERPRIRMESIQIEGNKARVTVRTSATGQGEAGDALLLRRERGRWRVDSLGG